MLPGVQANTSLAPDASSESLRRQYNASLIDSNKNAMTEKQLDVHWPWSPSVKDDSLEMEIVPDGARRVLK